MKLGDSVAISDDVLASRYHETSIDGAKLIDVLNSGTPINVGQFHLESGAGPGCEAIFFDQLNRRGSEFGRGNSRNLLMHLQQADPSNLDPYQPCGNQARLFEYRHQVYFETKPREWPPQDTSDEYHRVARIRDGKAEDVCGFTFGSAVELETEAAPTKK